MLTFDVYRNGKPAKQIDLSGAYAFGQDAIPVVADLGTSEGRITCVKRVPGAAGLAVMWDLGSVGTFLLPTTRLPDRNSTYNLCVELARAQMFRIIQKREDWGLFDYDDARELNQEFAAARAKFVRALQATNPAKASQLACEALSEGVTLGEKMSLFHADIFLKRRKSSVQADTRTSFGAIVNLDADTEMYRTRLHEAADFLSIPMAWQLLEPKEQEHRYVQIDSWINFATHARKPVHAGPLLSFDSQHLPDWLYIWEHDYETLRDLIYEHVQRIASRYSEQVQVWNVVSGIHANNSFNLSFEQLMELTRMCCLLVKKLSPHATVMLELVMPWGEYYAHNRRTIPPLMYADMAVQSGIKFDAFGVQLMMGIPQDGYFVRDLLQISSLLDEFMAFGKTVHVSACQVPSNVPQDKHRSPDSNVSVADAGKWHGPWSPRLQAEWLQAFYRIAISKPFIESICWRDLADYHRHRVPNGGLCHGNMKPKLAYHELRNFKALLQANSAGNSDKFPPTEGGE